MTVVVVVVVAVVVVAAVVVDTEYCAWAAFPGGGSWPVFYYITDAIFLILENSRVVYADLRANPMTL